MKIVALSDTHTLHNLMHHPVPDGDILLVAGDIMSHDIASFYSFEKWIKSLPHEHKVVVAGNHDKFLDPDGFTPFLAKEFSEKLNSEGVRYLDQEGVEIKGLKIWGEPRQPEFNDWAFNVRREDMGWKCWDRVPKNTNILLTHGPPFGYGDRVDEVVNGVDITRLVGCKIQKDLIEGENRLPDLKAVVCGHIHQSYGIYEVKGRDGVRVINASICNEKYEPVNKPIEFEIP